MTIRDATGRDITDSHYRVDGISQAAMESSRRAIETAHAKPSGRKPFRAVAAMNNPLLTNRTPQGTQAMEAAMADTLDLIIAK